MYRKILNFFSHFRIPLLIPVRTSLQIGDPKVLDALGSTRWKEYCQSEKLFDTWAPVAGDKWEAFHCATLFAALDWVKRDSIGSAPDEWFAEFAGGWILNEVPTPRWLDKETWLILDAPGWISVAVAAQIAQHQTCQTICTFDNWPHQKGIVKPEMTLAALIRYAPLMEEGKRNWVAGLPPVWVCDNTRLGTGTGRPGEFDNRYFLDDSILPGPELLKLNGIRQVVYAATSINQNPVADLVSYLGYLAQRDIKVRKVSLASLETWKTEPVPIGPLAPVPLSKGGFFRSTAGGFGAPIPEPSSSSG